MQQTSQCNGFLYPHFNCEWEWRPLPSFLNVSGSAWGFQWIVEIILDLSAIFYYKSWFSFQVYYVLFQATAFWFRDGSLGGVSGVSREEIRRGCTKHSWVVLLHHSMSLNTTISLSAYQNLNHINWISPCYNDVLGRWYCARVNEWTLIKW